MSKNQGKGSSRIEPVLEIQLLRAACWDWRLSRGDLGVYAAIVKHANENGECFPGPTLIARLACLSLTKTKSSIRRLEQFAYLRVQRPGLRVRNAYALLPSPRIPSRAAEEGKRALANFLQGKTSPADVPSHGRKARYVLGTETGYQVVRQLGTAPRHEGTSSNALCESTWNGSEEQTRKAEVLEAMRRQLEDLGRPMPDEENA